MAVHQPAPPPLEGQIAGPSGLSTTTSLAAHQDAGVSSSFISAFLGDKYVLRDVYRDMRVH